MLSVVEKVCCYCIRKFCNYCKLPLRPFLFAPSTRVCVYVNAQRLRDLERAPSYARVCYAREASDLNVHACTFNYPPPLRRVLFPPLGVDPSMQTVIT